MKVYLYFFILWLMLPSQSLATMVHPIASGYEDQEQYIVEIKSIGYFYRLNIYNKHNILIDSTIQFTQGSDLDAFIVEGDNGNLKVVVVMTLDDLTEANETFVFDGEFLVKS